MSTPSSTNAIDQRYDSSRRQTQFSFAQQCSYCVMDDSDPDIQFDDQGVCSNCRSFRARRECLMDEETREQRLNALVAEIKKTGRNSRYDCIVGVSGGVDSTYVAYTAKQLGLRPLAVHVDNGWNSELAVSNIEGVLKHLDIDLYTHVIDWDEFRDLQIAFLKSSTVDAEMPTDHAIRAVLRRVAARENVRYLLNGRNLSTERLLPWNWSYCALDWRYMNAVHKRYGERRLKAYPHQTLRSLLLSVLVRRVRNIGILDYVTYNKAKARKVLIEELGWKDYGGKHYESVYTRFFQGYILPQKFGIDKRKAHLSTLICTGQITREEALLELEKPPLPPDLVKQDKEYVVKKLALTMEEFDAMMQEPRKNYDEYPNCANILLLHNNKPLQKILRGLKMVRLVPREFARSA